MAVADLLIPLGMVVLVAAALVAAAVLELYNHITRERKQRRWQSVIVGG